MQSLKIIIFRDTDKPYTMIISSGILIGIAFSIIALMSLLTFSVMSNVMFYNGDGGPIAVAAVTEENLSDAETENPVDDSTIEDDGSNPEDEFASDNGGESLVDDGFDDRTVDEGQDANLEEGNGSEAIDTENTDVAMKKALAITPYMPVDSEVEAFLLQDAIMGANSIRVRAQVQKRQNLGQNFRGRFCVALVDNEGNIGPAYPSQIIIEGIEVQNPERANTFRIAYRRNYDFTFRDVVPQNYSAIVFYIFDEQTQSLQWRNAVPLTR